MSEDIYDLLKKNGFIRTDKELKEKRKLRLREKKKKKLLKIKEDYSDISDEDCMNEREKYIQNIDNIAKPTNIISHIFYIKNKYIDELKNYEYIDINNFHKIKLGGFIRCVGKNGKLFWGGLLIKIKTKRKIEDIVLVLKNKRNNIWEIIFQNNFVFYKKNKSKSEKLRDLIVEFIK